MHYASNQQANHKPLAMSTKIQQMSDAITVLHNRVSVPRVTQPGPDDKTLAAICQAALRAADHALLRPWRFLLIRDEALQRLADLWEQAALVDNPQASAGELAAARSKALRAPLIIVGIASPREHPSVPLAEQHLSAGAALQNMLNAAYALGVGAVWRTGPMASHPVLRSGLGLQAHESLIGFLYMGTPSGPQRELKTESIDLHFKEW
jgi:nitroreductase